MQLFNIRFNSEKHYDTSNFLRYLFYKLIFIDKKINEKHTEKDYDIKMYKIRFLLFLC
jgi:hypothetical protein